MNGSQDNRMLLEAVSFAARAHQGQKRKDGRTPYAGHPFRVCLIVRHLFGFDDPRMLIAALLHDTIEDTTTDFDDVAREFSPEIAEWVAYLTKDKRLPEDRREEDYVRRLREAPWPVQVRKLADVYDNLLDMRTLPAERREHSLHRAGQYLEVLRSAATVEAGPALRMAQELYRELGRYD